MLGIEIPINDRTQINESIKVLIFYEIDHLNQPDPTAPFW